MELIAILFKLAAILILLAIVMVALFYGALFFYALWPFAIGITIGVIQWNSGHDNIAVAMTIAGIVGECLWMIYIDNHRTPSVHWTDDKKKIYNKHGEVIRYEDKK